MLRLEEERRQADRKVSRAEIEDAVQRVTAAHPEIEAVWLFGSYARGRERRTSDVDLALLLSRDERPEFERRCDLRRAFEATLGIPVDVVILHPHLDRPLIWEALSRPVLLYARDPGDAAAFASWLRSLVRDEWPRLERRWQRTLRSSGALRRIRVCSARSRAPAAPPLRRYGGHT